MFRNLFNKKPNPKPRIEPSMPSMPFCKPAKQLYPIWNSTFIPPKTGEPILIIMNDGSINTDKRYTEEAFEFNDLDVCWCYQHEFDQYVPHFLRVGVVRDAGGVIKHPSDAETKSGAENNSDAGGDNDKSCPNGCSDDQCCYFKPDDESALETNYDSPVYRKVNMTRVDMLGDDEDPGVSAEFVSDKFKKDLVDLIVICECLRPNVAMSGHTVNDIHKMCEGLSKWLTKL